MPKFGITAIACGVAAAVGAMALDSPAVSAGGAAVTGHAHTAGIRLNVRSAPSLGAARVRTLADGSRLTIACRVTAQRIAGVARTTSDWDRLSDGTYVSDANVSRPVRPTACTAEAVPDAPPTDQAGFVHAVAPLARQSMRDWSVPASVTMAQAILESDWGRSGLSRANANYFGIKCFDGVHGPIAVSCRTYRTGECDRKGRCHTTRAPFRGYLSVRDSFRDHGRFLVVNSRYHNAFRYSRDPDRFAAAIAAAGYATSPHYGRDLVRVMRGYDLYRYDT